MMSPIDVEVLLTQATSVLKTEILPEVSDDKKYQLLMCINAISIALRQHQFVSGELAQQSPAINVDEIIEQVRSGKFDNLKTQDSILLLQQLEQLNAVDVQISNPKAKSNYLSKGHN